MTIQFFHGSEQINTEKAKIVIFKSRNRKITKHLDFRISGQKILPVDSVKSTIHKIIETNSNFHVKHREKFNFYFSAVFR